MSSKPEMEAVLMRLGSAGPQDGELWVLAASEVEAGSAARAACGATSADEDKGARSSVIDVVQTESAVKPHSPWPTPP